MDVPGLFLTWDTIHTYVWDGYGKLSSIDSSACGTNGECVTYDAMGRIVETSYNSVYTEIWYTQLGKSAYMHGSTPYYAYWPTPGNGTAEVNGNAVTFYYMHKDWLGNSRISSVIVNPAVVSDQAYAPYGEVYNKLATGAGVPAQMFTGDTQDIIGGIFDTPNRELNASQGRWLSPDPAGAGWNLYAYVTNNPNSNTDPLGLDCGYGGSYVSGGCQEYSAESGNPGWELPNQISCWDSDGDCGAPTWGGWINISRGGPTIGGQHIFSGQDCLSCFPLGPDPMQILQDVLSGNLWGALHGAGVIPQDSGCEFGSPCIPTGSGFTPYTGPPPDPLFLQMTQLLLEIGDIEFPDFGRPRLQDPSRPPTYGVPGTECSRGCHPEPFTPGSDPYLCKDLAILGLGLSLVPPPEGPLVKWVGYGVGNALGAYGVFFCP